MLGIKFTHNVNGTKREYEITSIRNDGVNLTRELLKNGWDGNVYFAISRPIGKQRKEYTGMFYRNLKTGEFK